MSSQLVHASSLVRHKTTAGVSKQSKAIVKPKASTKQAPATPTPIPTVTVKEFWDPLPFWKVKKKVYESIVEERKIVITSDTDKIEGTNLYQMKVQTAGLVNVPLEAAWRLVRNFELLPRVDERFKEVKYYSDRQRLYVHLETYGYHARMIMQLKFGEIETAKEIHFEVVEGQYVGMTGVIRLEDYRRQKTEIALISDYKSSTIPLPRILMGVGLEFVASRVAISMRQFIEEEHKKNSE